MKLFTTITLLMAFAGSVLSQTQNDTIFNYHTNTPVTIDGQATEECWENAKWNAIDQVWIPWGTTMKEGDFQGRFKVSWDKEYLYVLVEVVDDMLSDDHSNPLDSWWEDDCLEVFVDENRSMGDHTLNCNAFAYHVSLSFDAVDLNSSSKGVNYKDNIEVDMDTIADKTYLWEFAIKNYSASFDKNNPEASRVFLEANKKMGFTIAYCDNDETTGRENFIGSVPMIQSQYNDMYKNADHFGFMILVDPDSVTTKVADVKNPMKVKLYPVPAMNYLTIATSSTDQSTITISISTITGQVVKTISDVGNSQNINIEDFETGIYIVKVVQGNKTFTDLISKQ